LIQRIRSHPAPRPNRPYLVIAGETAVGKSEVAIGVAERLSGEIVIADSRQVYRGLDIGTAKPSTEERARVAHHLLDVVDVGEPYTAADFARDARSAIVEIEERGGVAVVCGGTGFYLSALAGALDDLPVVSPDTRARLSAIPLESRHARLAEVDPEAAARLHPHDRQRIERALVFWLETGAPISSRQRGGEPALAHVGVRVTRPRPEIHARIEARLDRMLSRGLEEEARGFWARGFSPDSPGLDTIGYQEWWPYFEGTIDRATVRARILAATRQYAKRQATWFRHQGSYEAIPAEMAVEEIPRVWRAAVSEHATEGGR
jgi:tRNA dimethylallyltransferase